MEDKGVDRTAGHLRTLIERVRVHLENPDSTKDVTSLIVATELAESYLNRPAD